jgi:hypothetical protein
MPMRNFIETQNIAHFKALLKAETDADKRSVLLRLLAKEEVKLAEEEAKRIAH